MLGVPKFLNTRFDWEVMLSEFPDEAKQWLRDQLTARERWLTEKNLYLAGQTYQEVEGEELIEKTYESDEPYIEDETHRIQEMKDENDVVIGRVQEVWGVDPQWYVSARLNLSIEEVNEILGE